jgi:hypothetical protein
MGIKKEHIKKLEQFEKANVKPKPTKTVIQRQTNKPQSTK